MHLLAWVHVKGEITIEKRPPGAQGPGAACAQQVLPNPRSTHGKDVPPKYIGKDGMRHGIPRQKGTGHELKPGDFGQTRCGKM